MAERRMFHTSVVESDAFLDMPLEAQALYFHLGMHADDDGFINGPRQITRMLGTTLANLELLTERGFLLRFGDVVVLRHFLVANSLKNDRLKPLRYPEVAAKLYIRDNRWYETTPLGQDTTLLESRKLIMESKRNPKGRKPNPTQENLTEENPTEENQTEENQTQENLREAAAAAAAAAPGAAATAAHRYPEFMHGSLGKGVVLLSQEQVEELLDKLGLDGFDYYVDKLSSFIVNNNAKVKNHYATILKWWQEDKECLL